jgi:hypothetical protein
MLTPRTSSLVLRMWWSAIRAIVEIQNGLKEIILFTFSTQNSGNSAKKGQRFLITAPPNPLFRQL